jgi:hypothetical protein
VYRLLQVTLNLWIWHSAYHGSVDLALGLATGQLLGRDVYMGPPLSYSALSLLIVAGGPASVGLAYKHEVVLALMLLQLYFMLA